MTTDGDITPLLARLAAVPGRLAAAFGHPPLPAFDERRWQEVARYQSLPVTESLETLRLRRAALVRALRGLRPADWVRTGTHEVRGPLTVLEIARGLAVHDEEHCAQVERMTPARGA